MGKKKNAPEMSGIEKRNFDAYENLLNTELFVNCKEELKNRLPGQKHSIYKKDIFSGLETKREKTKLRGQLRQQLQNFVSSFFACNNATDAKKVMDNFFAHYAKTYVSNNFSVESVSSSDETKKDRNLIAFMKFAKQLSEK